MWFRRRVTGSKGCGVGGNGSFRPPYLFVESILDHLVSGNSIQGYRFQEYLHIKLNVEEVGRNITVLGNRGLQKTNTAPNKG